MSFFIVSGISSILTFLFSEIYCDLELLSLVPFTSRDCSSGGSVKLTSCSVLVPEALSTHLDSLLVKQEQLEGPSLVWLSAVGLKWEEFPWDWQLVLYSSKAF